MNNETHSRPAEGSLATMMASGSLFAGGPGSGPKPGWQSDSPKKEKLDEMHNDLVSKGFKHKYSASNSEKGTMSHVYDKSPGTKNAMRAQIDERANGNHSVLVGLGKAAM